jgi:hypothetical protein
MEGFYIFIDKPPKTFGYTDNPHAIAVMGRPTNTPYRRIQAGTVTPRGKYAKCLGHTASYTCHTNLIQQNRTFRKQYI